MLDYHRRKMLTFTIQNSVLEPASHGKDLVMAVLPLAFVDSISRRENWRGATGGIPRSTTNARRRRFSTLNERIKSEGQGHESLRPLPRGLFVLPCVIKRVHTIHHSVTSLLVTSRGKGDYELKADSHSA